MASTTPLRTTTVGRSMDGASVPSIRRDARTINHSGAIGAMLPRPPPPADVDRDDPHADDQRQRWSRIEEERRAPGAGFGQHALSELPHEVVEDVTRGLPRLQFLADDRLHLARKLRVAFGPRLPLADGTHERAGHRAHPVVQRLRPGPR